MNTKTIFFISGCSVEDITVILHTGRRMPAEPFRIVGLTTDFEALGAQILPAGVSPVLFPASVDQEIGIAADKGKRRIDVRSCQAASAGQSYHSFSLLLSFPR